MRNVLLKMAQRRKDISLSWELWSDVSSKTVDTLKKQMAETANPTLSTMLENARALRGSIEFLTDEEMQQFAEISTMKDRIEYLRGENEAHEAEIEKLTETVHRQEVIMQKMQERIEQKDKIIERKDKTLDELLHQYVVVK